MGYFGYGLTVMLINVLLVSFFLISYFKEIMDYLKENEISYSRFDDNRATMLIILFVASCVISILCWPIIVVLWSVGLMYLYIKDNGKFKRIMDILKEES